MLFKNASATFHGVIFAVIGRIINQLDREAVPVCERNHTLDELRTMARQFWAVIQINLPFANLWIGGLAFVPPKLQAIDDEVTRFPATCRRQ